MKNTEVIAIASAKSSKDRMLSILSRLNESVDTELDEDEATQVCPTCGVEYQGESCPQCGGKVNEEDEELDPVTESDEGEGIDPEDIKKPEIAEEKKVNESTRFRLAKILTEYRQLCESEEYEEAKKLIEDEEVEVKVDPEGTYEIKESDEKDPDKKVTLTEEELEEIKEIEESFGGKVAGKRSRRINESRRPKKATKARARRSLTESYRKTRIMNAVQKLAMQEGISFSSKKLQRVISEAYRVNEDEIELPEDKIKSTLESALEDEGVTLKECDLEMNDGVLTAHTTLEETEGDAYLGDIADKIQEELEGYDVDYDEPEVSESDEGEVYVDFHFVPVLTTECEEIEDEESITESDEDEDEILPEEDECVTPTEESEDEDEEIMESLTGGKSNVSCKINPAFIRPGQIVYDADSQAVFEALTESVATRGGYEVGVEIHNSTNASLAKLAVGSEVTLTTKGNYYLLKRNPLY